MRYFRRLYKIEAKAKQLGLTDEQRYELRQKESKPIVMEFHQVEGAEALGIYFSVIQSARARGLEPESYLTAVFKAIPL